MSVEYKDATRCTIEQDLMTKQDLVIEEDPNQRIAPWFGLMNIEQQRIGKKMDFQRILHSLDEKTGVDLFSKSFDNIYGGNKITGYRNKNKFTFGYARKTLDLYSTEDYPNTHVVLGFVSGAYPATYITDCSLACTIDDTFKKICKAVENIVKFSTIKPFLAPPHTKKKNRIKKGYGKPPRHLGVWHYLTIRHSVYENIYMVMLTNFTRYISDANRSEYNTIVYKICDAMKEIDNVKSFLLCEYQRTMEPQPDDVVKLMYANIIKPDESSSLCEKILNRVLNISPLSFFQINTETTEILYLHIKKMFQYMIDQNNIKNPDQNRINVLIDMYCGTGSIGICIADMFDHIIGIDSVNECIVDAKTNAEQNGIKNCHYVTGRCEDMLPEINKYLTEKLGTGKKIDLYLLVDPARDGLHKRVRKFIKELNMQGFVYCSCNVKTWTQDIEHIVQDSDALIASNDNVSTLSLTPYQTLVVDMFPHTQHYEVLSCFMKC